MGRRDRGRVLLVVGGLAWYHERQDQEVRRERQELAQQAERREKEILQLEDKAKLEEKLRAAGDQLKKTTEDLLNEEKRSREEATKRVAQLTELQRESGLAAIGAASEVARVEPAAAERAALVVMRTLTEAERAKDTVGLNTAMTALANQIRLLPHVMRLPNARGSPAPTLASSDGILSALSLRNRQLRIWRVEPEGVSLLAPPATIDSSLISWDSRGRRTAWVSGRTLHVWDAEVGEQPGIELSEGFLPVRLMLSPNGDTRISPAVIAPSAGV